MVLEGLDQPFSPKMEVVTYYLTKPQYSYKQASFSFLVNHSPQVLITSVSMTLFESLGYICNPRYIKPTILAFLVVPD